MEESVRGSGLPGPILLVDDDPAVLEMVRASLSAAGIPAILASTGKEALAKFQEEGPAAVVLDLGLPDLPGKEVLARLHAASPEVPVVVFTGEEGIQVAVDCMRRGAYDFIQKPFEGARLLTTVRNALSQGALRSRVRVLAGELARGAGFDALLGKSPALERSLDLLRKAAASSVTILLEGESGTGKEVASRAVHFESPRRTGPFVAVNCGAIPETLIESELFGHEKGAFTGAIASRVGLFERADGGTVLLDEIGELRRDLQVRLLRVLQEREVVRIGGGTPRRVDVRVLCATNRDLRARVASGDFREDLFYRISVFPVVLPPLRDRKGDVLLLAEAFIARFAARHGEPARPLTADARTALERYPWPGNVRELENVLERATILEEGPRISLGSLPEPVIACFEEPWEAAAAPSPGAGAVREDPVPPAEAGSAIVPLEELERRAILRALEKTGWRVREAAHGLGIGRATLYRRIEQFGLKPPHRSGDPP